MGGRCIEALSLKESQLEYYDAPQAGWVRCVGCERRFAFECEEIAPNVLWHWALVTERQAASISSPQKTFEDARRLRAGQWISIVEDRRAQARCSSATMELAKVIHRSWPDEALTPGWTDGTGVDITFKSSGLWIRYAS